MRKLSQRDVDRLVKQVGKMVSRRELERDGSRPCRPKVSLDPLPPVEHPEAGAIGATLAERNFVRALESRHPSSRWLRAGWPDFLVENVDGRTIGIEVKHGQDDVSQRQALMFDALERAGIAVYVWHTGRPTKLTPWRDYVPHPRKKRARKLAQLAQLTPASPQNNCR